jgi:hypothetical protein
MIPQSIPVMTKIVSQLIFNHRFEKSASVERVIRAIVERSDGVRLQVDYGKDGTAAAESAR